jgi:tol-pal system protein YbgF
VRSASNSKSGGRLEAAAVSRGGHRIAAALIAVMLAAPWLAAPYPAALAQTAPAAAPPSAAPSAAPAAKAKPPAGGDTDLRRRVEQLEEQLVDLQVVIGTLESLARSGGGGAPAPRVSAPAGLSAGDNARIDSLEVQIRALTSQIEQLQSGRATGAVTTPAPATPEQFGSTTVNAGRGDPIGGLLAEDDAANAPPPVNQRLSPAPPPAGGAVAGAPPTGGLAAIDPAAAGDPKQAYERALGLLLQQNYGAAQVGFTDFLKSYPRDSLVPNALYWLGETHYAQRNYADAAEAFDLVTQGYGNSNKAPDSMLKRGMALAVLGKKPEACAVLGQLPAKYPSAQSHLKSKADSERQRIGCN